VTQHDRILQLLTDRGEQGVHSFEFYEMRMPRAAAVVCALKKEGHAIEAVRETYKGEAQGVRYFLRSQTLFGLPEEESPPTSHHLVSA